MEEKKLTDEEILKALECCAIGRCCSKCPYIIKKIDCILGQRMENDLLNLIHRQKAEIERLTNVYDHNIDHFVKENSELQKQVDERENEIDRLEKVVYEQAEQYYDCKEQAVKDTAKEILKWLKAEVIMTEIPHGSDPCEENVEAVMWWKIEELFKKKYGVEVE